MPYNVPPAQTDRATFPTRALGKALFLVLAGYEPTDAGADENGKLYFRFPQDAGGFSWVYGRLNDVVMEARDAGTPLTAEQLTEKADEIWSEYETAFGGRRM